jgi:hypothetical protein
MYREYNDLLAILAEVRRSVADGRYIWCVAADGFETTVSHRQGLILGGAWSPQFLSDKWSSWWNTPWTVNLRTPAIVRIERAVTPISEWIPLMEALAQAGESLPIVTKEISTELLHTLIVNALRETLGCCAVRAVQNLPASGLSAINTSWEFVESPPKTARLLPKAAETWSRRNATVLFPSSDSEWRTVVNDITVISVGGKNQDDQHDRLRFLVETIQDEPMMYG